MSAGLGVPQWRPGPDDRARTVLARWTDAMASTGRRLGHPPGSREWARDKIAEVETEAVRDYLNRHARWDVNGLVLDETPGLTWGPNGFEAEQENEGEDDPAPERSWPLKPGDAESIRQGAIRECAETDSGQGEMVEHSGCDLPWSACPACFRDSDTPAAEPDSGQGERDIQGRCPSCGGESLFLGGGGYVTCSRSDCTDPDAATTILERTPAAEPERVTLPDTPGTKVRVWLDNDVSYVWEVEEHGRLVWSLDITGRGYDGLGAPVSPSHVARVVSHEILTEPPKPAGVSSDEHRFVRVAEKADPAVPAPDTERGETCSCGEVWKGHPNPHALTCPSHNPPAESATMADVKEAERRAWEASEASNTYDRMQLEPLFLTCEDRAAKRGRDEALAVVVKALRSAEPTSLADEIGRSFAAAIERAQGGDGHE